MDFKNEKELLDFLSSLDEKNMSEYLSKKFIKWYRNDGEYSSNMQYRMQIINSMVYWSGTEDTRVMFENWKNVPLAHMNGRFEKRKKNIMKKLLEEIKIFQKNKQI